MTKRTRNIILHPIQAWRTFKACNAPWIPPLEVES
jgi:hypothetical protein